MGRKSREAYTDALGLREVETGVAEPFEAEFAVVTGWAVRILSDGESPDRIALIDGIETGLELTSIKAGGADDIIDEFLRLARQKHESYERRGIFSARPIILFGNLDWPAPGAPRCTEGAFGTDRSKRLRWLRLQRNLVELKAMPSSVP